MALQVLIASDRVDLTPRIRELLGQNAWTVPVGMIVAIDRQAASRAARLSRANDICHAVESDEHYYSHS